MKTYLFPLFLVCLFLGFLGCKKSGAPAQQGEFIELPITLVDSFGGFEPLAALLSRRKVRPNSIEAQTQVELKGVPEDWEGVVVRQVVMDYRQYIYQNFIAGTIDSATFQHQSEAWGLASTHRPLSQSPIHCFTHVAIWKNDAGKLLYKVDLDNNRDFSNDPIQVPVPYTLGTPLAPLVSQAHRVEYETVVQDQVKRLTIPLLIVQNQRGALLFSFSQHAVAEYNGHYLYMHGQFTNPVFDEATSLRLGASPLGSDAVPVHKHEYVLIEGIPYKNLGVDFNRQTLTLQKFSPDSVLYSSQTGFYAIPFSTQEFTTGKPISLESFQGKHVFVDFWGSWCSPCIKEIPHLKEIYGQSIPRK